MSSALSLVLIAAFWMAGRLLLPKTAIPLVAAVAGAGIWYMVWLVGVLLGISGPVLFGLFAWVTVACTFFFKSDFKQDLPALKSTGIFLALVLPSLALLNSDIVIRWDEISHYMRNADMVRILDRLPTRSEVLLYDWSYPEFPLAFTAFGLPAQWITGAWTPAVWSCLNLLFMALAADAIYKVFTSSEKINYAAIGVVAFVAFIFNPFQNPTILASGYVDPMLGISVFAATFPLMLRKLLPQSTRELLPFSFAWVCVVGLKEIGVFLMVIALMVWGVRALIENNWNLRRVALQMTVLIVPALVAWLVWKGWLNTLDLPKAWNVSGGFAGVHWERLGDTLTNMFKGWWGRPHAFILLLGYVVALWLMLRHRSLNLIAAFPVWMTAAYSGLILFIFITIFPDGMGRSAHSYWRYMEHIQYLMLAGMAVWLLLQLSKLSPQWQTRVAYATLILFIGGQAFITPVLQPPANDRLKVAMALAEDWKDEKLPPYTCLPAGFDTEQMEMLRYEFKMRTVMKRCDA